MECINFVENGILEENSVVIREIKNAQNPSSSAYSNILSNILSAGIRLCSVYSVLYDCKYLLNFSDSNSEYENFLMICFVIDLFFTTNIQENGAFLKYLFVHKLIEPPVEVFCILLHDFFPAFLAPSVMFGGKCPELENLN